MQVIFRKRATNYTARLQKITYEDKASYDSTPLCTSCVMYHLFQILLFEEMMNN